ncbi:conserved protein of unknown function [Rhodovastum atsumiense]|uniref:Uncharacterized protein n=1 Tax=Rhodovastum atsumiense TaxID=504468 RepID=A0A5M6IQR1_9PROT|nr:hypothetical protein [Rhodovastum atsumiense]KAA5610623.1 hypothetical protein F1189_18550 [Rhodovastum atsumiense]CAH2600744.1 conserved protein of unknown function [Rhodovastum atsumiense]
MIMSDLTVLGCEDRNGETATIESPETQDRITAERAPPQRVEATTTSGHPTPEVLAGWLAA